MNILILSLPIFCFNISQAFKINQNKLQCNYTHYSCRNNRNNSLELFDSASKSISKCPVYNCLASNFSFLDKKVKEYVPGGWFTALSVPVATFISYKWLLKKLNLDKGGTTLHRYQCTGCGYVIFPARNREEKFFSESFTCPNCGSPRSRFTEKYK